MFVADPRSKNTGITFNEADLHRARVPGSSMKIREPRSAFSEREARLRSGSARGPAAQTCGA